MKVYRFNEKPIGRAASVKTAVVIAAPTVSDSKLDSLKDRFPNSLIIAEVHRGTPAREGCFNVLRLKSSELEDFDYDLKGCRAILVEDAEAIFHSELIEYRNRIAEKAELPPQRIRFCCHFLSEQGCDNFSCYSAGAIRDYAAEVGITGVFPTSKKEVLKGNSLCLCVKSDK